jgi:hypothetical protein
VMIDRLTEAPRPRRGRDLFTEKGGSADDDAGLSDSDDDTCEWRIIIAVRSESGGEGLSSYPFRC